MARLSVRISMATTDYQSLVRLKYEQFALADISNKVSHKHIRYMHKTMARLSVGISTGNYRLSVTSTVKV